jgi:hypothetical protein
MPAAGEACDPDDFYPCAYDAVCNAQNVCDGLPAAGEPCDALGAGCAYPALCVKGACTNEYPACK